jgi:hypothetical protein
MVHATPAIDAVLARHFDVVSPGVYDVRDDSLPRHRWFRRVILGAVVIFFMAVVSAAAVFDNDHRWWLALAFVCFGGTIITQELSLTIDSNFRTAIVRRRCLGLFTFWRREFQITDADYLEVHVAGFGEGLQHGPFVHRVMLPRGWFSYELQLFICDDFEPNPETKEFTQAVAELLQIENRGHKVRWRFWYAITKKFQRPGSAAKNAAGGHQN